MAENASTAALNLLPLSRVKDELRLDPDDSSQDTLLTGQVEAAVSFVSALINRPLLPEDTTYYCKAAPYGSIMPFAISRDLVTEVKRIDYWSAQGNLSKEADKCLESDALGRYDQLSGLQYAPDGGWPETLAGSCWRVTISRCYPISTGLVAIQQALVLCVRQFYDGYRELRPNNAILALIAPFRYYGL